jgi:ribosome-associated toxin RatA of RatAB toxin-antitoxin module
MIEHHAGVTVNAPVHQVYTLFSHFNDFPKFMSFVKEVTYYDDQRSHWVAEVAGEHSWDAVNEDWIPDQQIGWHSVSGLHNRGRVLFQPVSNNQTHVDVNISYDPPAGILGDIGEHLGAGKRFDDVLQHDLDHFAKMVDMAPANANDPAWSQHLFHPESAAAQGKTTERQNATMGGEFAAPESSHGATAEYASTQPATNATHVSANAPNAADATNVSNVPNAPTPTNPNVTTGTSATAAGATTPQDLEQPKREEYVEDYTTRSGTGVEAQGTAAREDTLVERPILDQDIINEPTNVVPPGAPQSTPGQSYPGVSAAGQPTSYEDTSESDLPPEQIPPRRPEGNQPQR